MHGTGCDYCIVLWHGVDRKKERKKAAFAFPHYLWNRDPSIGTGRFRTKAGQPRGASDWKVPQASERERPENFNNGDGVGIDVV